MFRCRLAALTLGALACAAVAPMTAQTIDATERERAREMLANIRKLVQERYYDPTYNGLDLNAHFKSAHERLATAQSVGHAYSIIAQALIEFGSSHTYFIPPARPSSYAYGWEMLMVGDDCFVVAVDPRSDAAAKGLKPGDRLLKVEAFNPSRRDLWKLQYVYTVLSPRPSLRVAVQSPGGAPRELDLRAKVTPGPAVQEVSIDNIQGLLAVERDARLRTSKTATVGDVRIWKLPAFALEPSEIDRLAQQATKGAAALVLDLRGNGGGLVKSLEQLTRHFFDREVRIADLKGRRSMKGIHAKKRGNPFTGRLVVLVDSGSASAAEVFARTMQLEKRGTVIGDRSAGSVMQGVVSGGVIPLVDTMIFYGASVTDADIVMPDGHSLEGAGVVPDEVVVPTAADLAAGRDPVLARAIALLGGTIDAVAAGALFPIEWK